MVPATVLDPPVVLFSMLGGAALLWGLATRTQTGRAVVAHLDQGLLVAFQIPRVMGAIFLVGWAAGIIPWQFALLAGLGGPVPMARRMQRPRCCVPISSGWPISLWPS